MLNVQIDCLSRPNITIISSAQTLATLIAIQTILEEIVKELNEGGILKAVNI